MHAFQEVRDLRDSMIIANCQIIIIILTDLTTDATPPTTSDAGRLSQTTVTQCRLRVKASIANPVEVVLLLKTDWTDVFRCKGHIFIQLIGRLSLTFRATKLITTDSLNSDFEEQLFIFHHSSYPIMSNFHCIKLQ